MRLVSVEDGVHGYQTLTFTDGVFRVVKNWRSHGRISSGADWMAYGYCKVLKEARRDFEWLRANVPYVERIDGQV